MEEGLSSHYVCAGIVSPGAVEHALAGLQHAVALVWGSRSSASIAHGRAARTFRAEDLLGFSQLA